ncbi:nucleotidyltransferase domain-containing protein [Bifidobacterium eulemuris]|uniref:Nucleotidyltransferase n=2 Tax=Bifidobacterium eulemuris TaxID=1765219 RepID=A0A261GD51_9BIFI|nr:nucleotidyltransferase domain-containing protein [Bifidobacterium eulemuris]OZG69337.1 nucleotidyltransferase [Bifidobacterium eulemuris]
MKMIDELKDERVRLGLSQKAVAEAMGTTQSAVSRAERVGNPTQDFLQRYKKALDGAFRSESTLELETLKLIISKVCRQYGLAEVWLYGSMARGEARPDSDVDLLYRLEPDARFGMMQHAALLEELRTMLGREVSLTSLTSLERHAETSRASRRFFNHIKPDMIKVA